LFQQTQLVIQETAMQEMKQIQTVSFLIKQTHCTHMLHYSHQR